MTLIKHTETHVTYGDKTTIEKTEYYEVGAHEADEMLKRVELGEDEEKLREELIKKSTWSG